MHEKPRDDRGQGKHTPPPRAARKTHLKRRAATARRGSRPKNLPRATKDGGHLPRRSARREGSRTPCQKRENTPEATRSAAGIQGHPQQRKPRTGQPERPQNKRGDSPPNYLPAATAPKSKPANRGGIRTAEAPHRNGSGSHPRRARTREKAHKHPRQGKTTARRRGGKKRSQRSERGTPRRSAPEAPAADGRSNRARANISAAAPKRYRRRPSRTTCREYLSTRHAQNAQEATPAARAIPDHDHGRTRHRTHAESRTKDGSRRPNYLPQPRHAEKGAQK